MIIGQVLKNKSGKIFYDRFGKELSIGDKVLYLDPAYNGGSYSNIVYGYVLGYYDRNILIQPFKGEDIPVEKLNSIAEELKGNVERMGRPDRFGMGLKSKSNSNHMIKVSMDLSLYESGKAYDIM